MAVRAALPDSSHALNQTSASLDGAYQKRSQDRQKKYVGGRERREQPVRLLGNRSGDRNTYQKSADRRGNLEALRQTGHQQYGSKDGEQNDFVGLMRRQPADPVTVPHRSHQNTDHHNGNGNGD